MEIKLTEEEIINIIQEYVKNYIIEQEFDINKIESHWYDFQNPTGYVAVIKDNSKSK